MEHEGAVFAGVVARLHARNDERSGRARARVAAAWTRGRWAVLACLGISVVLAGLASTAIVRGIVRSVRDLRDGAARLGTGDLTARIAPVSAGEFAEVARSLNAMASDLAAQQNRLVRTERQLAVTELAAGIAHEINNPLGIILGYVKLMRKSGVHEPESLAIVEDEASRAAEIVQGLLDLTRPLTSHMAEVDLAGIVRDTTKRLRHLDGLGGVSIEEDLPEGGIAVRGDEGQLRRLAINLVRNAAQAAGPGGRVRVTAAKEGENVRLSVDDSGPGIPDELRERVLDPFFTTKSDGAGLGLSIVQAVLARLDGVIGFEHSGLGGTRVVVAWRDPGAPTEVAP
jgi:signal transduction histidine kinase